MLKDIENFDLRSLSHINRILSKCHSPELKLQFLKDLRDIRLDLLGNGQAGAARDYQWGTKTFRVYRCQRCQRVRKLVTKSVRRGQHGFCEGCKEYKKTQDNTDGARPRKNTLNHRSRRHDSQAINHESSTARRSTRSAVHRR